jgi:hypothetical protein
MGPRRRNLWSRPCKSLASARSHDLPTEIGVSPRKYEKFFPRDEDSGRSLACLLRGSMVFRAHALTRSEEASSGRHAFAVRPATTKDPPIPWAPSIFSPSPA